MADLYKAPQVVTVAKLKVVSQHPPAVISNPLIVTTEPTTQNQVVVQQGKMLLKTHRLKVNLRKREIGRLLR